MKDPIPGSHIGSPEYIDVEARIYAERMKELTAGDKMTSKEAAYVLAREDNEKAAKLINNPHEYVPVAERQPAGWQLREAAEQQVEASQPQPDQEPEKTLKFFEDREPRPNYALLREETAAHSEAKEQPKNPANDGPAMEAPQGEQLVSLKTETPEQHQEQEPNAPANDQEPTRPERTLTFHEDRHPGQEHNLSR